MKIDSLLQTITYFIKDFLFGVGTHFEAVNFLKKHKIWVGFWQYRWLTSLLLILGTLTGLAMFGAFFDWFSTIIKVKDPAELGASLVDFSKGLIQEGKGFFYVSSLKYVVLLLNEVLIFHVIRRTLEILTKEPLDGSFKTFWAAQLRMFQIVLQSWVFELILTILISIALGILGLSFLKPVLIFGIQAFFIGFMFIDNYNERYQLTIKKSIAITKNYAGLATVIGMFTYVLMMIPLVGVIVGPVLGAVTAAIAMHQLASNPEGMRGID